MKTKLCLPLTLAFLFSTLSVQFSTCFAQGSLTPPGAPAPTMKSLAEIEPRVNLQNAPGSAVSTSDTNYHFIILQPGSYYLSSNIVATKSHAIKIAATNVTLDLSGFNISGTNNLEGIEAVGQPRATIRNGSISGFAYGIGLDGNSHAYQIRDVVVSGCTFRSIITAGSGGILDSCRLQNNSGESGITAGPGAVVTHCTAYSNNFSFAAIYVQAGSTVADCAASMNPSCAGFLGLESCTFRHCSSSSNSIGLQLGTGDTAVECNARVNATDGFLISLNCYVFGNTADANVNGFRVTSGGNRIDNNTASTGIATGSPKGFVFDNNVNILIRNTARGYGSNAFVFNVGSNAYGPIVNMGSGGVITETNPWANFSF